MLSSVYFYSQRIRLHGKYYDSGKKNGQYALLLPNFEINSSDKKNIFDDKDLFKAFQMFVSLDFSVLILSYRGFGKSQGVLKEEKDVIIDSSTACDWIVNSNELQNFAIFGIGNGALIANDIGRRRPEVTHVILHKPNFFAKNNIDPTECHLINVLACIREKDRVKCGQVLDKIKEPALISKVCFLYALDDNSNIDEIFNVIVGWILESLAIQIQKKVTKRRRRRVGKTTIIKKKNSN